MSWDPIIGQDQVVTVLQRAVERDRVAHAYLFEGPHGVGKHAVALEFARVLQCQEGGGRACGQCQACGKVSRMVHPDVHVFFPYPSDVSEDEVVGRRKRLGEEPYAEIDFTRRPSLEDPMASSNKQALYRVDRVREMQQIMSYVPHEGQYKVGILTGVERFRTEAANAFLKLLEEPAPRTVFILTTPRPDQLLATILSRCQRLRFDTLSREEIHAGLLERMDLSEKKVRTLARMADGSFTRALELAHNKQLMENRELALSFFRMAYRLDTGKLADTVDEMASMGREQLKGLIDVMISWIRDLILYGRTEDAEMIVNADQEEAVIKFCRNVPDARVEFMVAAAQQANELIGRNVRKDLVLLTLAHRLHQAMRGKAGDRLYEPLAQAQHPAAERAKEGE